jgi:ribosomal protein S12 methylthiotransferase
VLAKGAPFVPYVDLPLQHVNDRILALMGRRVTRSRIEEIVRQLRAKIPGVFVRTAFIVGFPSETRAEFDELLDFLRETKFERLGAFAYSPEEGTPAAALPGQIPFEERIARLDELMRLQAGIAFAANASLVGTRVPGIIDGASGREDRPLLGRTAGDAPDVDGTVFASGRAKPGDVVTFKIVGVDDYDLLGEVVR